MLLNKLARPGGFEKLRFTRQKELSRFVKKRLPQVKKMQGIKADPKLARLLEIIRTARRQNQKVLIFCHFLETAKDLAQTITKSLRGVRTATSAGKNLAALEDLLRRFAPLANGVPADEKIDRPVDVLIATGTLAEGFNLQDAEILVNYDLPWTIMVLAQRIGRILRPWQEARSITVHNFIPSTMFNEEIAMAVSWLGRLLDRHQQHLSFADIPLLATGDPVNDEVKLVALTKHLDDQQDIDYSLDDALEYIQQWAPSKLRAFWQIWRN